VLAGYHGRCEAEEVGILTIFGKCFPQPLPNKPLLGRTILKAKRDAPVPEPASKSNPKRKADNPASSQQRKKK
jgi:hypothetical protein